MIVSPVDGVYNGRELGFDASGTTMSPERSYRHLLLAIGSRTPRESNAKSRFRENLDTAIIGLLSSSVGIVALIVVISGILGSRVNAWHNDKIIYTTKLTNYLGPSNTCAVAVVVGELLGLTGIAVAWSRGRRISLLSTLGALMCIFHMFLYLIYCSRISS
jgi:hypothetical protein